MNPIAAEIMFWLGVALMLGAAALLFLAAREWRKARDSWNRAQDKVNAASREYAEAAEILRKFRQGRFNL